MMEVLASVYSPQRRGGADGPGLKMRSESRKAGLRGILFKISKSKHQRVLLLPGWHL